LSTLVEGVEYHSDVELKGLVKDTRIDLWGNLTVPKFERLELRNVTVVFHNDGTSLFGLRTLDCTELVLSDGDGDANTTDDMTNISGDGMPWFLKVGAGRFEIRNVVFQNVGIGRIRIGAGTIQIRGLKLTGLNVDAIVNGEEIMISDSVISALASIKNITIISTICNLSGCNFTALNLSIYKLSGIGTEGPPVTLNIVNCAFRDCRLNIAFTQDANIRASSFNATDFFCEPSTANLTVSHSSYSGSHLYSGILSYAVNNSISNTSFDGFEYGFKDWWLSEKTILEHCNFTRCMYAIWSTVPLFRANEIRIRLSQVGLFLNVPHDSFLSNISVEGCRTGIYMYRCSGNHTLENGSFSEINGTAVVIEDVRALDLTSGRFYNTTFGVRILNYPNLTFTRLEFHNNSFEGFTTAIECNWPWSYVWANVSICNNSFNGRYFSEINDTAVFMNDSFAQRTNWITINDNVVRDCRFGMQFNITTLTARPFITFINNAFYGCKIALNCSGVQRCMIEGLVLKDFETGVRLRHINNLQMTNVSISSGDDGLQIHDCKNLSLSGLNISNVTQRALWATFVNRATWTIPEPTCFEDCRISTVGEIRIDAALTLRNVTIHITRPFYKSDYGIFISRGVEVCLESSSVIGDGFPFKFEWGCDFRATNSSIIGCGRILVPQEETGLYAYGSTLELVNVRLKECGRGLVLKDSVATLELCHINALDIGLHLISSNATVAGTRIEGAVIGFFLNDSKLEISNSVVNNVNYSVKALESVLLVYETEMYSSFMSVDLENTTALIRGSRIASTVSLFRIDRSYLEIWAGLLDTPDHFGTVHESSHVRIYNVSSSNRWNVTYFRSFVEVYWSHDVSAVYRWNHSLPVIERIFVFEDDDSVPIGSLALDPDRSFRRLWLLEKTITSIEEIMSGPYIYRIAENDVFGEVQVLGDQPSRIVIEVRDISPPEVTIEKRLKGLLLNTTVVPFTGAVHELGSGILRIQYTLDELIWSDLPPEDGDWESVLEVFDGDYTLTVRVEDLDGNMAVAITDFAIDTIPPRPVFISPKNGTAMANLTTVVEGHVLPGKGSPIVLCRFQGVPVVLNSNGHFRVVVDLVSEGPSSFTVEACDEAGNLGASTIVIVRDLTPPTLLLDPYPKLTNQPELTTRVACADVQGAIVTLDSKHVATLVNDTFYMGLALEEGRNLFILAAEDTLGNRVELTLKVVLDTQLNGTIAAPPDHAELKTTTIELVIMTDPHAYVRVVDHTNWFNVVYNSTTVLLLELEPGVHHRLVVEFRDAANNTLVQAVSVTCHEPKDLTTRSTWNALSTYLFLGLCLGILLVAILLIVKRQRSTD
jgi:hypothetical protein